MSGAQSQEMAEVGKTTEQQHAQISEAETGATTPVATTPVRASFHIFKAFVGAGVFLLPAVHKEAGYIGGPLLAALLAGAVIDVSLMLVHVRRAVESTGAITYNEIAGFVFGSVVKTFVSLSLSLAQLGFCVMYLQIAGGIVKELTDSGSAYMIVIGVGWVVTFIPSLFTHHVQGLAMVSMFSTLCLAVVLVITFGIALGQMWNDGTHPTATRVGKVWTWGLFIPKELTALAGIAPMLPVFNSMGKQDRDDAFEWIYGRTVGIVGMLYLVYGAIGYIAYGDDIDVSLVSMLPVNGFGEAMRVALALALLTTYPIQFLPAIEVLDGVAGLEPGVVVTKSKAAVGLRVGVTLGVAAVAVVVGPDTVEVVQGLIGATMVVMLLFIVPSFLILHHEYALEHATESRSTGTYWRSVFRCQPVSFLRLRSWFYVGFGIFVMVVGVFLSMQRIVEMNHDRDHEGYRPSSTPVPDVTRIIYVPVTPPPTETFAPTAALTSTGAATTTDAPTTTMAVTTPATTVASPPQTTASPATATSSPQTQPAATDVPDVPTGTVPLPPATSL